MPLPKIGLAFFGFATIMSLASIAGDAISAIMRDPGFITGLRFIPIGIMGFITSPPESPETRTRCHGGSLRHPWNPRC